MHYAPLNLQPLPKAPLVSVLLSSYNYEDWIAEAIVSVQKQSYTKWELIVCDDGSTDGSVDVIRRYCASDSRIKLIAKRNGGQASSLNAAYRASAGDILCILDSDDVWFANKIESVITAFNDNPSAGMVGHPLQVIDHHKVVQKDRHPWYLSDGWVGPALVRGDRVVLPLSSAISLRRPLADRVFPIPEEFRAYTDAVIAQRAALLAPVVALAPVLGQYRVHGSNYGTGTGIAGPTTAEGCRQWLEFSRRLLNARAQFADQHLGVTIDVDALLVQEHPRVIMAQQLFSGGRATRALLSLEPLGSVRFLWFALFYLIPRPISKRLFQIVWGDIAGKRWWWRVRSILFHR